MLIEGYIDRSIVMEDYHKLTTPVEMINPHTGKSAPGFISGRYWGHRKYDITFCDEKNPKTGETLVLVYVDEGQFKITGQARRDILQLPAYQVGEKGLDAGKVLH